MSRDYPPPGTFDSPLAGQVATAIAFGGLFALFAYSLLTPEAPIHGNQAIKQMDRNLMDDRIQWEE